VELVHVHVLLDAAVPVVGGLSEPRRPVNRRAIADVLATLAPGRIAIEFPR
jgi:hypothetical protein